MMDFASSQQLREQHLFSTNFIEQTNVGYVLCSAHKLPHLSHPLTLATYFKDAFIENTDC